MCPLNQAALETYKMKRREGELKGKIIIILSYDFKKQWFGFFYSLHIIKDPDCVAHGFQI